ncbi:MAG: hypothetical protein ABL998_18980 [Planctomycetota bacterium]
MNRRTSFVVLGLFLLVTGCKSVARQEAEEEKKAQWRSLEVAAPSDRMVWQLMLLALQSQGFPLAAGTDPGARQVESGWKTDLQPFRGEGTRSKATLKLAPIEKGRWKLEARVRVEKNQNLVTPLDATRAEWEPTADDPMTAQVLLGHVRARLRPELELEEKPEAPAKPQR